MKITLVIFSMRSGGAERVMSTLANHWVTQGKEVTLVTLDSSQHDFYPLDSRITRIALNLAADSPSVWVALKNTTRRIIKLRQTFRQAKPDIIMSFMDVMNITTLLATRGLSVPVIVAEHTNTDAFPPPGIWNKLRPLSYPWADAIVVLTERGLKMATQFAPQHKLHVIPNPALPIEESNTPPDFDLPSPFIVSMGRLSPEKGFDLLLKAFSQCNEKRWSLVIMGEGDERASLENLAKNLGIESCVHFIGNIKNPVPVLKQADLFVMSSHVEGFPNALIEAMCCQLPVISFDCPTGPAEIIRDGIDGVLVPPQQINALAKTMKSLVNDPQRRNQLALKAPEVAMRFSLKSITKRWETLLNSITTH